MMIFTKATPISLKQHPEFNEKWLQERIIEDPSLLGLGELMVKDVERSQPHAGRLDLLLTDPETATRYEVEIQLGASDESHIIRTIEYWDIERNRYPQYEHIAVIVAEDITSRFLNVISLFNRAIPLVAIQINALSVGDSITLNATTVLDLVSYGSDDDEESGQATDRAYWEAKGSRESLEVADLMLELIHTQRPDVELTYKKIYIGLAKNGIADNFVAFTLRKSHLIAAFKIPRNEITSALINESDLDELQYSTRYRKYRIRLTKDDLERNADAILNLIAQAANGLDHSSGKESG